MFQGLGRVFIVTNIIASALIVIYYHRLPAGQWPLRTAMALALGGALGNLIDRIRQGYVVDFIDTNLWPFTNFPVFNIADSAISIGVTIMIGLLLWEERQEKLKQQAAEGD
jgi:signal peptidase II